MNPDSNYKCDVLVVGSGPGGSLTALLLSQAGKDVILAEEGHSVAVDAHKPYSMEEMASKYRSHGMTMAFGNPKMNYLEACCVGGASEINAGLYHDPLPEVLEQWRSDFNIADFSYAHLKPYLEANERLLGIMHGNQPLGPGSNILKKGAQHLGWKAMEVSRLWNYQSSEPYGARKPMSTTLIPQALKAGCRLLSSSKVTKIISRDRKAQYALLHNGQKIYFNHVIVCGGAIQTPFLLHRSGLTHNIGNSLKVHPAIRVLAHFDEIASDPREGVPIYQIAEFKPWLTLGGSFSAPAHQALWMANKKFLSKDNVTSQMGIFYALTLAEGHGQIRNIPFIKDPWVQFHLTDGDLKKLGEGLYRLGELMFAAGAKEIYSPFNDQRIFKNVQDMQEFRQGLFRKQLEISTLHLFASCPMGETASCAVNSWGQSHQIHNLYVNDSSMLPGAPGVNPQALIMALSRRNTERFIKENA